MRADEKKDLLRILYKYRDSELIFILRRFPIYSVAVIVDGKLRDITYDLARLLDLRLIDNPMYWAISLRNKSKQDVTNLFRQALNPEFEDYSKANYTSF